MQETAEQDIDHPIKDHLVCYQQMSLRWHKQDLSLSDAHRFRMLNDNIKLMEVLVSSEDVTDIEQSMDKETSKELKRLDAKLNLVMAWMGQILIQQQAIPPLQTICLSSTGLQFFSYDVNELSVNDNLYMEIFLEPRYPQAFVTLAKVVQVRACDGGDEVLVTFQDLNEQNQQWLDKYVFQIHRRQVASARKIPK